MPDENSESDIDEGQADLEEFDLHEPNPFKDEEDEDDEIDFSDEESDEDEGQSDEVSEKDYKELQREFTKTKELLKEMESRTHEYEHKMVKFGGVDKAAGLLEYVSTDPDFLTLAEKKQKGEVTSGIDESKLSPEQKQAFDTVKQMVDSVLSPFKAQIQNELRTVIDTHVTPGNEAVSEIILEGHIDKMTEKYGESWLEQLDSMEKLKGDMSEKSQKAPTLKDIDELFHRSLREDGKFEEFVLSQAKHISEKKTRKSQRRPSSSGGSKSTSTKGSGKAKDIFEAGARAIAKMKG